MYSRDSAEFGSIRSVLWPIHSNELKKLVPMLLMIFLISINYSVLHNMKDSVILTATGSGAEVIPFIKVWVMLPMAVLLTYIFTKLSNHFSQERVFYIMISSFLICYTLFAFVLYPNRDLIHPHASADALEMMLPNGFKWPIAMYRNWSFTLFYVMSEMWSALVMSVLFWGFANEITRITEARRFYGVFGIAANIGAIIAGQGANYLSFGVDRWQETQMILVVLIVISGLLTMAIFRWINKNVLNDPCFDELHLTKKETKEKGKQSMRESFSYLSKSKYLLCIAVLVIAYNLVINLVEVVWKSKLSLLYPSPSDLNIYTNNLTSAIGVVSTIAAFFTAKLIGKYGWTRVATLTPMVMFVTCLGFFTFLFFEDHLGDWVISTVGFSPLVFVVFFGAAQNCLSRAAKYSVFDATKEMAYIPLDHECKLKGKAAIDGVGSRLGKSGGSIIHQGLLMLFTTLTASTPYVAAILLTAIVFWMYAVRSLGKQFQTLVASKREVLPPDLQEAAKQEEALITA